MNLWNKMKLLLIYCLFVELTAVLCCFHSKHFDCSCSEIEISCSGWNDSAMEMAELLLNISAVHPTRYLESLVLNNTNLTLPDELPHIDLDIKNLSLFGVLLDFEGDGFGEMWASLNSLRIQNSNLQLVGNLFHNLGNLSEVNLDHNNITELSSIDFLNLSKLEHLSIEANQLSKFDEDLLVNLPKLLSLSLKGNNFSLFSNVNIKSSSLSELFIQNCEIGGPLEENTLSDAPHVTYLDLSYNQLQAVNAYALSSLTKIKFLNLSNNVIVRLEDNAFAKLSSLETLDLSRNKIRVIIPSAFSNLKLLQNFDLSFNMIAAMLCIYTYDMPLLKKIDLRYNSILTIENRTFLHNKELQELLVEGNTLDAKDATICSPLTEMTIPHVDMHFESKDCGDSSTCDDLIFDDEEEEEEEDDEEEDLASIASSYSFEDNAFSHSTMYSALSATHLDISITIKEEEMTSYDTDISSRISSPSFMPFATESIASTDLFSISAGSTSTSENVDISPTTVSDYTESSNSAVIDTDISSSPVFPVYITESAATLIIPTSTVVSTNPNISLTYYAIHSSISSEILVDTISPTPTVLDETEKTTIDSYTENSSLLTPMLFPNYTNDVKIYHSLLSSTFFIDSLETPSITKRIYDTESSSFIDSFNFIETATLEDASNLNTIIEQTTSNIPLISPTSTVSKTDKTSITKPTPATNEAAKAKVTFIDYKIENDELCLNWKLVLPKNAPLEKITCVLWPKNSNGSKPVSLKCPRSGVINLDCIIFSQLEKFCLIVYSSKRPIKKVCSKEILSEPINTKNIFSDSSTTASVLNSMLTEDTILPQTTSSIISSSVSVLKPMFTDGTTSTDKTTTLITSVEHSPTTQKNYIPFSVISFEVMFDDSPSALAVWNVSKYELSSICNLTLNLFYKDTIYTETVFECKNNSQVIKNLDGRNSYKICLKSHHIKYGTENKCKWNSEVLYSSSASKTKDHGYKNSSLFAFSILLLVVLLLIICIVLRNLLKKRFIKDRYNVYIEEQNVQKRYSSIHQEPNVRYSSTPKE